MNIIVKNSILSPHLLRSIAKNGTSEQRDRALQTLGFDSTFRSARKSTPQNSIKKNSNNVFQNNLNPSEYRLIFNAHHKQDMNGQLVRAEGTLPTHEESVDEAYDGLGATFNFYWKVFERNSIDNAGMKLEAVVHFSREYDNAFWNGQTMVFGDGDGDLFNRFTSCLDIIGHELTHGITQYDGALTYAGQSGALNESISDVFGSLIKQFHRKQKAANADWLIGEGLLTNNVNGIALRSLKEPGSAFDDKVLGKDQQPAHVKDYINTYEDNGGVHLNSGIPNYAFYLLATRISDFAWDKAGRIWYETLRDKQLKQNSTFKDFAKLTILSSQRLFGRNSEEFKVTIASWKDVGIDFF
jgi:Zn-dependent metalloprotease